MPRGWPALQRLSPTTTITVVVSHPLSVSQTILIHPSTHLVHLLCPLFTLLPPLWTYRQPPQAATPAIPAQPPRRRAGLPLGGVTNQRLAIVNSTCAVKQLINKRLFTSCARSRRRRRWRRLVPGVRARISTTETSLLETKPIDFAIRCEFFDVHRMLN